MLERSTRELFDKRIDAGRKMQLLEGLKRRIAKWNAVIISGSGQSLHISSNHHLAYPRIVIPLPTKIIETSQPSSSLLYLGLFQNIVSSAVTGRSL